MVNTLAIVSDLVALAVTVSAVRHLATGKVREDFQVFRGLKPIQWAELSAKGIALAAIVIAACVGLFYLPIPFLQWSWLSLLAGPNNPNAGTNLIISAGASVPYFGILFVILLFFNLPRFARDEEETFREGTENWLQAIPRSLAFGFMHCIVGVPIAAGFALSLAGLWFTAEYFRGGVDRSTRVHAFYNMVLLTCLAVYVTELNFQR